MGYFQNGAFFPGDRIIPKSQELTDEELDLMLKRNLAKAYRKIQEDLEEERRMEKFYKELNGYDEFE